MPPPPGFGPVQGMDTVLLNALFWQAEKCATVMDRLTALRRHLRREYQQELNSVRDKIGQTRGAMICFADLFPLNLYNIHQYLNHIDMVLPSVSQTLDDMLAMCQGRGRFNDDRWNDLADFMFEGSDCKFDLDERFEKYARFFDYLAFAIMPYDIFKSKEYDWRKAERLRLTLKDLREDRGLKIPRQPETVFVSLNLLQGGRSRPQAFGEQWCKRLSAAPKGGITLFKDKEARAESTGPYTYWNTIGIPDRSKMLLRRDFNRERLSFTVFVDHDNKLPYALVRLTTEENTPLYNCRILHELNVSRDDHRLHLQRWSVRKGRLVPWAVLNFDSYEELVVTQAALLAFKAQMSSTSKAISTEEAEFKDDALMWERDIIDRGVRHKLAIYRDHLTGTKRLYASIARGERQPHHTPAWTMFFSNRKVKPRMQCIGEHKLIIKDTSLYTFGDQYLTSKHNPQEFEVTFKYSGDNRELKYLFEESFKASQQQQRRHHRYSV